MPEEKVEEFIEFWKKQIRKIEKQSINEECAKNIRADFDIGKSEKECILYKDDEKSWNKLQNLSSELETALSIAVSNKTEILGKKKVLGLPISEETTTIRPHPSKVTTQDEKIVGVNVHRFGASFGQTKKRQVQFKKPKRSKRGRKRPYA